MVAHFEFGWRIKTGQSVLFQLVIKHKIKLVMIEGKIAGRAMVQKNSLLFIPSAKAAFLVFTPIR